jgi:hypothetical protein
VSELLVTFLRLSYLILLWLLVIAAIGVLRRDVFGTRIVRRGRRGSTAAKPASGRAAVVGRPGPPLQPRTSPAAAPSGVPGPVHGNVAIAPPAPEAAAPVRLVVVEGPQRGTTIPLGASAVVLGRATSCTLPIGDDYASGRHARIFPHEGSWWVEDLGSTNGTFVDGERIDGPTALTPGRPVRVGQTVVELQE